MPRIAVIHTTPATLEPLKALALELIPGAELVNFVDDSILPQLLENGGDLSAVEERVLHYARFAGQVGVQVILSACSSVGELVPKMQSLVAVPVVRIDEAMAEEAVRLGERIGIAATLPTTLNPTTRLVMQKAAAAGKAVSTRPLLIEGAYEKLLSGDSAGHDAALAAGLSALAASCDIVVLAQASMARALPSMPESDRSRFLTSPRLAMQQVKRIMEGIHG